MHGCMIKFSAHKSVRRKMVRRTFLGWGCQPPFGKGAEKIQGLSP